VAAGHPVLLDLERIEKRLHFLAVPRNGSGPSKAGNEEEGREDENPKGRNAAHARTSIPEAAARVHAKRRANPSDILRPGVIVRPEDLEATKLTLVP
jgi:hypothetical protein